MCISALMNRAQIMQLHRIRSQGFFGCIVYSSCTNHCVWMKLIQQYYSNMCGLFDLYTLFFSSSPTALSLRWLINYIISYASWQSSRNIVFLHWLKVVDPVWFKSLIVMILQYNDIYEPLRWREIEAFVTLLSLSLARVNLSI